MAQFKYERGYPFYKFLPRVMGKQKDKFHTEMFRN